MQLEISAFVSAWSQTGRLGLTLGVCALVMGCGGRAGLEGRLPAPSTDDDATDTPAGDNADGGTGIVADLDCSELVEGPSVLVYGETGRPAARIRAALTALDAQRATIVFQQSAGLAQVTFNDWRNTMEMLPTKVLANVSSSFTVVSPGPEDGFGVAGNFGNIRFEHHLDINDEYPDFPALITDKYGFAAFVTRELATGDRFIGTNTTEVDPMDDDIGGQMLSVRLGKGPALETDRLTGVACACAIDSDGLVVGENLLVATTSSAEMGDCDMPSPYEANRLHIAVVRPGEEAELTFERIDEDVLPQDDPHCQLDFSGTGENHGRLQLSPRSDGAWLLGWSDLALRIDSEGHVVGEAPIEGRKTLRTIARMGDGLVIATRSELEMTLQVIDRHGEELLTHVIPHPPEDNYKDERDRFTLLGDRDGRSFLLLHSKDSYAGAFSAQRFDCR